MPNFIQVRASNPPHAGTYTPGRFWPNGVLRRLEIVDDATARKQQDEIFPVKSGVRDPAARDIELAAGPWKKTDDGKWVPDPDRICESGLKHIRENPRLSTLEGNELDTAATKQAVDAARQAAARAGEQLVDAQITISDLQDQLAQARAKHEQDLNEARKAHASLAVEHDNALTRIKDLEAQLQAAKSAPASDVVADGGSGDGETSSDGDAGGKSGKGKGGKGK